MSHPHKIAVLLPPCGPHAPLTVWRMWVGRQSRYGFAHSEASMIYRGLDSPFDLPWEARGFYDPLRMRGFEFDEIDIAHPHVTNELILAARTMLR